MRVIILKNGKFVDKASGEVIEAVTGKFSGIEFYETTNTRAMRARFHFKDTTEGVEDADIAISLERYGLAAVKVVRLLAASMAFLATKAVTLKAEKSEDDIAGTISLSVDGTPVEPIFDVPYSYVMTGGIARKLFVDQVSALIAKTVAGPVSAAFVYPVNGEVTADEAAAAIESDRNVHADKVTFADDIQFASWKTTVKRTCANVKIFTDADDIEKVLAARFIDDSEEA